MPACLGQHVWPNEGDEFIVILGTAVLLPYKYGTGSFLELTISFIFFSLYFISTINPILHLESRCLSP